MLELAECQLRTCVEHAACFGQGDSISAAVEKGQAQLLLEAGDGGENGGVRAVQCGGTGLEAAFGDYGIEAAQVVEFQAIHCRLKLQRQSEHSNLIG